MVTPTQPRPATLLSHGVRRLGLGIPLAVVAAVGAPWPIWRADPTLATVNLAVAVSLVATGVLISLEPGQRKVAIAMAGAGLLWPTIWSYYWDVGPVPLLAMLVGPLPGLLAVWGLMHYPSRLRIRWNRLTLLGCLAFTQLTAWVYVFVSEPTWQGLPAHSVWPPTWPNRDVFLVVQAVYTTSVCGLGVAVAVVFPLRIRRLVGPDRHVMKPVAVAGALAGVATAVIEPAVLLHPSERFLNALYTVEGCFFIGVPIAFLLAVLRRTLTRNAISVLADRLLSNQPDVVLPALRDALSDPNLEILYWVPDAGGYIDSAGAPTPTPADDDPTVVAHVRDGDEPLALIVGDPALQRHPQLSGPAARAVALSLANARMQAEIRVQIANVRQSQERLPAVVAAERRRIEDDIDSGARRQLQLLEEHLDRYLARVAGQARGNARSSVDRSGTAAHDGPAHDGPAHDGPAHDGPARQSDIDHHGDNDHYGDNDHHGDIDPTTAAIRTVRDQLPAVQHELRELARGFAPSVLDDEGLHAAVAAMAATLPISLHLKIPALRFNSRAEKAAYFMISEGITNSVKHSRATTIHVRVHVSDGQLHVEVADNGIGDADPTGHGLTGIAERMRTCGGRFSIDSPPGAGTRLTADLPQ